MRLKHLSLPVCLATAMLCCASALLPAQATEATTLPLIAPQLARTEGVDTTSGIAYTRIYVSSTSVSGATLDLTQPTLTAQCTKRPNGKLYFELFANFGGVTDTAFYPPWHETKDDLYPPRTRKVTVTMEFLGYTHVKPAKKQWEYVPAPAGQLRYNPPGAGSFNMEDAAYYLQYLRSLPTLRLTAEGRSVEFLTTSLLAQLHKEPLCAAAGQ